MKKSVKLKVTGSLQNQFFNEFVKENAVNRNVRGFVRKLENGRVEIFLEGDGEKVDEMVSICSIGPKYAQIRSIEQSEERFQDFKEFKILSI